MSVLYTGLKDRLYVGKDTTVKKTTIEKKTEEIKNLTAQMNSHVDKLNDLLSPENPHFSYIFPNYSISSIPDASLTESFVFNSNKVSELDSMPFTHQVEVFSSVTQDLKQTYSDKVKNLPEPLNSTELYPSNQAVIDRTLELAHNLPESVADTSEASPDKLINRAAFESYSNKLGAWKDEFAGFESDFSRKITDLIGEVKEITSKEGQEIFQQTSVVKTLENKLSEEVTKIKSDGLPENKEVTIQKSLDLNRSIEIEKAKLAQIPIPEPVKIAEKIEENKGIAMKYCTVLHDCVTKVEGLVTESFLGGKVPDLDWAKEKMPSLPEVQNKVASILDKIFNKSGSPSNFNITKAETAVTAVSTPPLLATPSVETPSVETPAPETSAINISSNTYSRSTLETNLDNSTGY